MIEKQTHHLFSAAADGRRLGQTPYSHVVSSLKGSRRLIMNSVNLMRSGSAPQLMIAMQRTLISESTVMRYPKKMLETKESVF